MKKLLIALLMLLPVTLWAQTTAEPYAVLSQDSLTVTFYYDDQKASRGGIDFNSGYIDFYNGEKNPYGSAVTAIFDESFANYTTLTSTDYWFMGCQELSEIRGINHLNTANVTNMIDMFRGCSSLTNLDVSGFNTANVTDMSRMFEGCSGLTSLDLSSFNTANVTFMWEMFSGCSGLTSLDVSGFNTANVSGMGAMFSGCSGLTSLDVSNFNTANVTNMSSMFSGCSGLTNLDLSGFNTANVTYMGYMFNGCSGLTNLDLSGFNTANVTRMYYMFNDCSGLTSLDLSGFNTANVTDMEIMFSGCSGLTSLDVSSFNTANVTNMKSMFNGCSGLTRIYAGNGWSVAAITEGENMFINCVNLIGGAGTIYDASHTDHTYARIDGGASNPGYFTAKDGQTDDDPLLTRLYDNLALTTTDGNAEGGNNDLGGSIDAAQTSLVRAMWNLQELPTDESYCVWMDAGIPVLNTNTWSNSTQTDAMKGLYARLYHGIILANNYLANQNDGDMGKQAEARFLRALQYYYLMDHFGNVPLLTDTIDRQPLPVWEATPSDIELLTREEMFSYIENELQDCLNSLPAANSYGRATATAARLLLARLYLNSEVYTGTARWQEARSYAESVINGGTFQLAPIYRNLFMGDNDSNGAQQEIILPAIYDGNTRTDYGGTTFLVASSFANGEGDNGTTQVWAGNVSKPDFVNKFFTQTADIPYASPEQTASAASDDRALFYGINHSYELRNGDSFSDGFPYQKFTNVRSNGTSPVSSKFADTDFPLMRLGEAYLIAAEADARLNGSATSMQGTQYINMLRNRANATISTAGYSLSDICDEWSREMGYEAVRRTTLIRFGRFGGQADYSWAWKGGSYDGSAFEAEKNTYPIPAVEVGSTPEPYAVLSQDSLTVTFYYDDQKAARGGIEINSRYIHIPEKNPYGTAVTAVIDESFANNTTLTSTAYWFAECGKLTEIRGLNNLNTANVTSMEGMFYACTGLTSIDVSGFNTANVTNMYAMFYRCSSLMSLDVSGFNTTSVTLMAYMFGDCSSLTILDVSGFNTANVTDMCGMFWECSGLTSLDVSSFNTANVTDMSSMFSDCYVLTSLDVSGFNTANVKSMGSMFWGCSALTSLDVSGFNTANVTNMNYMFYHCSGLTSLDVSGFNTEKVTRMDSMFSGCSGLTSLDVSGFNTANVTDMMYMFEGCSGLTSLDLSGFNTANVTNMGNMFSGCSGLTSLDLSGFNTANVKSMGSMFEGCSGLTKIFAGDDWNTALVTDGRSMFTGCTSLVGGAGTAYDANHTDHTYAHIDGGAANPGYFTDKNAEPVALGTPVITSNGNVITISTNTSGATVYYTLDGSTPTTQSSVYTGPITVTQNCCVSAIAALAGMDNSEVSTLEMGGLTQNRTLPAPVITHEGNVLTMTVPSLGAETDRTDIIAVEPSAWGGSAPSVNLSGEWSCSVLDDSNNVSETYGVILNPDGSAVFPSPCLSGGWSYSNGKLTMNHYIMDNYAQGGSYSYHDYDLTATTPENPIEFTGTRYSTVGNWITESNGQRNVRLNYNGQSLPVERVTTGDGRETTVAVVNEGSSERTGELMKQTITGLENGYYMVNLFAKSVYSSAQPMSEDVTYLFANDTKLFIPVEADQTIHPHNTYLIGVEVTDGTLNLGLAKDKTGASWHAIQVQSLKRCELDTVHAMRDAVIYYTTDDSEPSTNSTQYTTPVTVSANGTVKAFATAEGYSNSLTTVFTVDWIVPADATFIGTVLTVGGQTTMAEALQTVGRDAVVQTVSTIVWNSTATLTESDLQAIANPNLLIYATDSTLVPHINNVVVNGVADNVVLTTTATGNCNFYAPEAFTARRISYSREFRQQTKVGVSRGWESIALPFTVQAIRHETRGVIAPFGTPGEGYFPFWLRRLTANGLQSVQQIEANTAYIISMPNTDEYAIDYNLSGVVTFSAEDAQVPVTEPVRDETADYVMMPLFQSMAAQQNIYALNVNEERNGYPEGSIFEQNYRELRPFEAYTEHIGNRPAPQFMVVGGMGGEGTTGIGNVRRTDDASGEYYDLRGRKLQGKPQQKGVYIQNGKKIIVK